MARTRFMGKPVLTLAECDALEAAERQAAEWAADSARSPTWNLAREMAKVYAAELLELRRKFGMEAEKERVSA